MQTPKYANLKKDLAICVSVTYWKQDLRRVVEWVELNRMMGVSHITVSSERILLCLCVVITEPIK